MIKQKIIIKLFFLVALVRIVVFLLSHKSVYLKPYNHQEIGKIYSSSQYIKGPVPERPIGDDDLYAFAGYFYLFQKGDISKVNFENPPLGKYLIGLSIMLFKNAKVISIIYGLILIYFVYQIAAILTGRTVAIISVLIISFSPLFLNQLNSNMLDLPMTLFFTIGIYYYLKAKVKITYIFLAALFFALAFSVKFFPALIIFLIYFFIDSFKKKKFFFVAYLKSLLIIPIVYLFTHLMYFHYHPSFIDFLKYQRWIISWRSGNPYVVGNIINTLFLGHYKSWWDPHLYIIYNDWNIISPLILVLAILSIIFIKKKKSDLVLLWVISFLYFIYVFVGTTGVEKFLLPVYPLLVILASYTLYRLFSIIISNYGRVRS